MCGCASATHPRGDVARTAASSHRKQPRIYRKQRCLAFKINAGVATTHVNCGVSLRQLLGAVRSTLATRWQVRGKAYSFWLSILFRQMFKNSSQAFETNKSRKSQVVTQIAKFPNESVHCMLFHAHAGIEEVATYAISAQ